MSTSTSVLTADRDITLPAEFRKEAFYILHPEAFQQWGRREWFAYFKGMDPMERIELCDLILRKQSNIPIMPQGAGLAYGVMQCGDSRHVNWQRRIAKTNRIYCGYNSRYNYIDKMFFWQALLDHARCCENDHHNNNEMLNAIYPYCG
jgi:hypothetical protein